jgi:hypothetical protein
MFPKFELVLCTRDLAGNPTGQTKSVQSDKGEDLEVFLNRNSGSKKKPKSSNQENKKKNKEKK